MSGVRFPAVAVPPVLALALTVAAAAPLAGAAQTDSQKVFTQKLLDDAKTSAGVKKMLTDKTAIVDPRSGFVDVTGDGRQDAVVLVSTGGAGGAVALYVFSTHGQKTTDDTSLKVVFRLQSLYGASLRINGTTISVLEPRWSKGDDLCCPKKLRERDYAFDAKALTFRRVADKDTPFKTA
jgi:ABC-type oligopeptide transport system substrate-binding subunit